MYLTKEKKVPNKTPAYPATGYLGLTKREHFAALALQGMLTRNVSYSRDFMAKTAVKMAYAILEELENAE